MKVRNLLVKIFILLFFLTCCKENQNLEDYGEYLAEQSIPGVNISNFIGDSITLPPDMYIFYSYRKLSSKWEYIPEPESEDKIQNAERIIETNTYRGDCEDFSVIIMSICRLRGIDAVFCLGKNLNDIGKGHIWIEVPICDEKNYDNTLKSRINKNLDSNLSIINRNDTIWLSFIEQHAINEYDLEYTVDVKGNLRSFK